MTTKSTEASEQLEKSVHIALETYANVHRGSGYNSKVTTQLYDQAREIVLEYLGLNKRKYVVVFCSPRNATILQSRLESGSFQIISSQDFGLPLGLRALAVKRSALPKGAPFHSGGGTARLSAPGWVVWAAAPDKFEAGTPPIINVIAFTKALQLIREYGDVIFRETAAEKMAVNDLLYKDELEGYVGQELLGKLRETLIGRGIRVPTADGEAPFVNLDNGASTPTFAPIWKTVQHTWRQPAAIRQEVIREVRTICADVLDAPLASFDLIFTSNTTEAINLVAESLSNESADGVEPVVLNTLLEHTSNDLPWRMLRDHSLIRLPVDDDGVIELNALENTLRAYNEQGQHGAQRVRLVAVSGASNVLGTINNMAEISRIVHQYGALLLVDAAQLVAHRKVDVAAWGIDYLAFSAHKMYAPFGAGMLIARKGLLNFSPAEMELIQSSGEENTGGIVAMGKAFILLQRIGMDVIREEEQALTGQTLRGLALIPGLTIYGIRDPDSPRFEQKGGVIVFSLKGKMADRVARELSEKGGIGVRFGCHCAHILVKHILHVGPRLEQFQRLIVTLFPRINLPGVVRVTFGIENTPEDVEVLMRVLRKIAK